MELLTLLTLLSLLHLSRSDCVIDNRSLLQEWEKKLDRELKADHNWREPPNKCNATIVKVKFLLKYFTLDSENDVFTAYTWTTLTWKDPRLTWNISDYGGVEKTFFWSFTFWTPILELTNRKEDENVHFYEHCKVENTGAAVCVSRATDPVQCVAKLRDWPFDTQRCEVHYGIHEIQKNVHLVSRGERAVSMIGADYGPEWTIVDYEQINNVSDPVQLKITYVLERNGEVLGAIIIFPSILLSILTSCSLLLDVNDKNRFSMAIFSAMCYFFYLSVLNGEIPKHTNEVPRILSFFRFSVIFNLFLIFLTVALLKLRNKESIPPLWVIKFKSLVLESPGKYFIWPKWETDLDLLTSDSVNKEDVDTWNGFANIVNCFCFIGTVIVFFILICLYVPRPPPFN